MALVMDEFQAALVQESLKLMHTTHVKMPMGTFMHHRVALCGV